MSDFLVNLARRSIGLGSMIEVRTDPTDALPRAPETGAADAAGRSAIAPGGRDRIVEIAAPHIAAPPIAAPPGPERQAPAIAALPAPVIQRLTLPMPAIAPAVHSTAPAMSLAGSNDASAPRPVPSSMGEPERPAAPPPVASATLAERAAPSRTIEYRVQSIVERAIAIPAVAEIAPRPAEPATAREDSEPAVRVLHDAPVVEHVIAPRLATAAAAAEVPPPAPNRHHDFAQRTEAAPPERTIHVRIGAIEINGAEPPPQAPASPPPQPADPPPPGFDDFVHLRTYAPWAR